MRLIRYNCILAFDNFFFFNRYCPTHCQRVYLLVLYPLFVYIKGPIAHLCNRLNFSLICGVVENNTWTSLHISYQFIEVFRLWMLCVCFHKKHHGRVSIIKIVGDFKLFNKYDRVNLQCLLLIITP